MAGINEFMIFDENNQNSMTNETYSTDEQRLNGVALDMYIANNKIERNEEIMKQYQEFRELCRKHALNDIVEMLK